MEIFSRAGQIGDTHAQGRRTGRLDFASGAKHDMDGVVNRLDRQQQAAAAIRARSIRPGDRLRRVSAEPGEALYAR